MGRINLTALNVRKSAIGQIKAKGQTAQQPVWVDVVAQIPPAQILTRQQPVRHPLTQLRTRTLPGGRTEQHTRLIEPRKPKSATKNRHLFAPQKLRYEEDSLRKRFFSDHPWELARPRVVLETTGDSHKEADWSRGLLQPGIPLSGESVVQRQLWLLENIPDITLPQAYDLARKEFYKIRRAEETRDRIAAEEARHMGAHFGPSYNKIGLKIENEVYNKWETWAREQILEQVQRSAAFEGTTGMAKEESALQETSEQEDGSINQPNRARIGDAVFAGEDRHQRRTKAPATVQNFV